MSGPTDLGGRAQSVFTEALRLWLRDSTGIAITEQN